MAAAPERDDHGQPMTDHVLAVPDGSRGPAIFTPEQVEAARRTWFRSGLHAKCGVSWLARLWPFSV